MKYSELGFNILRAKLSYAVSVASMLCCSAVGAEEILIACQYNEKWYMSIVDTDYNGLQRVFGHNAFVTEHNKGFLRVTIRMEVSEYDLIFSGRSGAMSYDSGEIDPDVSCRLEPLLPPENAALPGRHDYIWYFNHNGVEKSYITGSPDPQE